MIYKYIYIYMYFLQWSAFSGAIRHFEHRPGDHGHHLRGLGHLAAGHLRLQDRGGDGSLRGRLPGQRGKRRREAVAH